MDSGGAGQHRGGHGVDKVYSFLEPGEVSIHDDRHRSQPWGIGGGRAAERSRKVLVRKDGTREELAAKLDFLQVEPGDHLLYMTAGGGGWGDPLARDPEQVRLDVLRRFVSAEKARDSYGVVVGDGAAIIDEPATEELRAELRAARGENSELFDFGDARDGAAPVKA
jgi:N-methylhydantoinase B